ncbi:MAG TPA: XdhC family protein [Gemmatimonadaceae bacterium]|jgi:Xanthine and CO dehydrogenases maturation factor, XdhC/CoxF family
MARLPDLRETFEQLDEIRRRESRVVMATLVSTKGTTPRREGAKMWVGEGGRILGSVTIGGCVDARVAAESEEVLREATPRLLTMALGDEDAWELGLTCGGTVEVLIEPVALDSRGDPVVMAYDAVRTESEVGRRSVAVVPLGFEDLPSGSAGVRLVVREDGSSAGTLGDSALDRVAIARALEVMRLSASRSEIIEFAGTRARLYFELHGPATSLIIFGAGQVAIPLVRFATVLGWHTTVVDGRERYATRERFPQADEIRIGLLAEIAEQLQYDASTFVVLVAHDYKFEVPVLRVVLRREPAYIGLLGNRARGAAVLDFLAAEGIDADAISRVHVPVGLDIGALTSAEIALSVLAEALAVRNDRPGTSMRNRKPT